MQVLKIVGLLLLAGALVMLGMIIYKMAPKMSASVPQPVITNFEECVAAGNPIMESYPPRCMTKDGRSFTQDVPQNAERNMTFNGCAVAGCSQQLCVSADEAPTIITTCEYRAEYACYKKASCERQTNGVCGWTETLELKQCLAHPPAIDNELEVM